MKIILHVTEALGGGVANSVSQLANIQSADGSEVIVCHSVRQDTPSVEKLHQLFPAPIRRIVVPMVTHVSMRDDLVAMARLKRLFAELEPDVIHLHSSKAGVLGRIAARALGWQDRVFYSPRGFSFLRQDVSKGKQVLYLLFERIAARLGGVLIGCSESEVEIAQSVVRHPKVRLVENSVRMEKIFPKPEVARSLVRVITSGRICYQKAPWRFRELASRLSAEASRFVWIGDGELRKDLLLEKELPNNLEILGWMEREGVLMELSLSDIFVLPSLWEGMPLALIEAQATGLPAVVMDVVGCRDVVRHGQTGFVCGSMGEVVEKVRLLIRDDKLRTEMGREARRMALERFSVERMHRKMTAVYGITDIPSYFQ